MTFLITAQGRRAVKKGTLRSCQHTKGLIKVNSTDCIFTQNKNINATFFFAPIFNELNSKI